MLFIATSISCVLKCVLPKMAEEIPPEITLDLLIHPWYGLSPIREDLYGVPSGYYRELQKILSQRNISSRMYADLLFNLYLDRFDAEAHNPQYRVIFVEDDRSYLRSKNDLLAQQAKEILGEKFIREAKFEYRVHLLDLLPEVVRCSKVNLRVYGEVSVLCVSAYSNFACASLSEAGLSFESRVLSKLCGDRVEGKEELLK